MLPTTRTSFSTATSCVQFPIEYIHHRFGSWKDVLRIFNYKKILPAFFYQVISSCIFKTLASLSTIHLGRHI